MNLEIELTPAQIAPIGRLLGLTPRECAVLALVIADEKDEAIASKLEDSPSPHTVRSHLRGIFRKLNVKTRARASYKFGLAHAAIAGSC